MEPRRDGAPKITYTDTEYNPHPLQQNNEHNDHISPINSSRADPNSEPLFSAPSHVATYPLLADDASMDETTPSEENMPLFQAIKQYSKLVGWIFFIATAILYWGYDAVILGSITAVPAFQEDFGEKHNDKWIIPSLWLALWSALGPVGQAAGAFTGGYLQDRIGRRKCLLIGSVVAAFSVGILFVANRPADMEFRRGLILAGKILQGYGLAFIKIQSLTYVSENVPTVLRGASMALFPTFTLLGQLIGGVIIFVVTDVESDMGYLVALGSQWLLAIPPFVLSFVLPESPAYLARKKDITGALKSLTRLYAPKNDPEKMLHKLQESIEEEERNASKISYSECFNAHNRRRTWIIIFANQLPNFFGLPLLSSVSYFLQQVGMDASHSVIFLIGGIVLGLCANGASTWTLSNIGRRKLTITTLLVAGGLWGGMGMVGIKETKITPWLTAGFSTLVVVICGLGAWPASYTIMSESSSLRLRAKSQAIGGISNYIATIGVNFGLPYIYNPDAGDMGAKTGFVFAGLCLIGAALMWVLVPEMKGRSMLEIDHMFEQRVKARGSSKWKDRTDEIKMHHV